MSHNEQLWQKARNDLYFRFKLKQVLDKLDIKTAKIRPLDDILFMGPWIEVKFDLPSIKPEGYKYVITTNR